MDLARRTRERVTEKRKVFQDSDNQKWQLSQTISTIKTDCAVKDGVNRTLQKQNGDQQSNINGCLSQAMKLLTPEPLKITPLALESSTKDGIWKVGWLVLTNKRITPVQVNVLCNATKILEDEASV